MRRNHWRRLRFTDLRSESTFDRPGPAGDRAVTNGSRDTLPLPVRVANLLGDMLVLCMTRDSYVDRFGFEDDADEELWATRDYFWALKARLLDGPSAQTWTSFRAGYAYEAF